jgi:hypothetical protein
MSKQINLVINGKGGVGKSFFATNFVQYLKDRCLVPHALDTDHENSTLTRFHPEAGFVNLEDKRGLNEIFTAAETNDLLVIDCRAASNQAHSDSFQLYEGSKTRGYLRDTLGAREMTMPRLYDWLVTALNQHNVTVTGTFKHPAFHFLDRQRLRHWQNKFYEEVDAVAEMLLPVASTSTPGKTVPSGV